VSTSKSREAPLEVEEVRAESAKVEDGVVVGVGSDSVAAAVVVVPMAVEAVTAEAEGVAAGTVAGEWAEVGAVEAMPHGKCHHPW
jgi:hypothetical protein